MILIKVIHALETIESIYLLVTSMASTFYLDSLFKRILIGLDLAHCSYQETRATSGSQRMNKMMLEK